jgi:hypothetical protein
LHPLITTSSITFCGYQGKFFEFTTLKHGSYKPNKMAKMATRYPEAVRIIGGGEFTKPIPDTTILAY